MRSESDLHAYVEHLRQSVPECVHPSGASWIRHWLGNMRLAARDGDLTTFYTLAQRVRDTIDREVRWHRESLETAVADKRIRKIWGK